MKSRSRQRCEFFFSKWSYCLLSPICSCFLLCSKEIKFWVIVVLRHQVQCDVAFEDFQNDREFKAFDKHAVDGPEFSPILPQFLFVAVICIFFDLFFHPCFEFSHLPLQFLFKWLFQWQTLLKHPPRETKCIHLLISRKFRHTHLFLFVLSIVLFFILQSVQILEYGR